MTARRRVLYACSTRTRKCEGSSIDVHGEVHHIPGDREHHVWMPLEIDWLESGWSPYGPDWYGPQEHFPTVLTPGLRLHARLPCIPAFIDEQLDEGGVYDLHGREYVEKDCPWQAELYLCRPSDYTSAAAANEDLMRGFLLEGWASR